MPQRAMQDLDHELLSLYSAAAELQKLYDSDVRVTRSATSKAMHALSKATGDNKEAVEGTQR